jgi:hypothetical protein
MKSILLLILTSALALGDASLVNGKGQGITDPAAFRTALGLGTAATANLTDVQTGNVGFLDRFDNASRYSENATITHNSSMPEIGGNAYRVATNGTPRPKIASRALEPQGDSLDYFANRVSTAGGVFNMGLVVDFSRTSVYATAVNNGGFTIGVSEQELVSSGGSIGGISGTNPIHVTIKQDGVTEAGFYLGASFTCQNASLSGGAYPWTPTGSQIPFGEKTAVLFRISGDILEVEAVGLGSLYFYHPDISTKIGSTTHFFYEPNGPDLSTDYRQISRLHRWWVNAERLDQTPGYGITMPNNTGGNTRLSSALLLYPNGQTARRNSDAMPGHSLASMVVTGTANVTKGSYTRPTGGNIMLETQIVQNYGYNETGASIPGFMLGAVDTNLNAIVSSTAGAETNLSNCGFVPLSGAENADWQEWYWAGTLTGTNSKRIRLNIAFGGGDPGTPGNLLDSNETGTPLNAATGFYEIRLHRYTNSTASHTFYAHLDINGTRTVSKRVTWNGTTNYIAGTFKVTTADAAAVTVDTFTSKIARVNAP